MKEQNYIYGQNWIGQMPNTSRGTERDIKQYRSGVLDVCFIWAMTAQGHEVWCRRADCMRIDVDDANIVEPIYRMTR